MSRGDEPNADPSGSPQAELAAGLTGLRQQLDTAIHDFEAVRAEAEAKVVALHSHLKQISAGMSKLEVAISAAVVASDEAAAQTAITEASGDSEAAHEIAHDNDAAIDSAGGGAPGEPAGRDVSNEDAGENEPGGNQAGYDATGRAEHELTGENEAAEEAAGENEAAERATEEREAAERATAEREAAERVTAEQEAAERVTAEQEAAERATAEQGAATEVAADKEPAAATNHTAGSRGATEYKPVAARKEPVTAADIALAMLEDLALESPTNRGISEPTVVRANDGQSASDNLLGDQSTQSTTSVGPLLKQEFAEYFEPVAAPLPAPEPTEQSDIAAKVAIDDWA
jgi:trimeric autotransporter adhesin